MLSNALWSEYLQHAINATGRSWEALGFCSRAHFQKIAERCGDDCHVAVHQTEQAAAAIAEALRSLNLFAREPEVVEDRICAIVPKVGDMVRLSSKCDVGHYACHPYGALDKEGTYTGQIDSMPAYD